jgi:hypothetical protein
VAVAGPNTRAKWSHIPITFTKADIKLVSFPHTYAMVIIAHIDKWDITRILIDNSRQAEILFLSAFDQMGLDRNQLKETTKLLYGFRGKRVELVGSISLPVSFGSHENAWIKHVTFNVIDMHHSYNVILGRGFLNTFEVALHSGYLYLKVTTPLGVLPIHGSQRDARNIEQGFTTGHMSYPVLR